MKDMARTAIKLLGKGECFVHATILESHGSTPRGAGANMIIRKDCVIAGTVGGGALEGSVIAASPEVFSGKAARVLNFTLDGNDVMTQGAVCGGRATVLVDYIDAQNPSNLEYYTALLEAARCGGRSRVVTVLPSDNDGASARHQCLLLPDGSIAGEGGVDAAVIEALCKKDGGYDAFASLESNRAFLHAVGGDGTAYIFGAGHCGEKLARLLATVGFRLVVIDDRAEFANGDRFPEADEVIVPSAMDGPFRTHEFDADSYIVIVTRGHRHDETVLRGALKTNACYIGMIGSKRKRETIYRNILASGYARSDIDRVCSPVGLPIGAESPEEIAVSIAAEMIKVRAERRG